MLCSYPQLYGCETWTLQKGHEGKLQALEMRYLRRVEGVTQVDKVRNEDVRQALRQATVLDVVKAKQMAWKEKLEQMDDDRFVKCVYEEDAPRKGPRGHPRKRWHEILSSIIANVTLMHLDFDHDNRLCWYANFVSCLSYVYWLPPVKETEPFID